MRTRAKSLETVFAEVPRHHVFEGGGTSIIRGDGTEDSSPFIQASSELRIPFDELVTLDLAGLLKKLDRIVEDITEQKAKHFFQTISQAVEKVGNTVDGKGQRLSAKLYLEVLKKIWIEFDSDGKARLPTLVIGPNQREAAMAMQEELMSNSIFRRQFEAILERKREIWRAREADRELVG